VTLGSFTVRGPRDGTTDESPEQIWRSLYDLVREAEVPGVLANRLGPFAAGSLREHGRPVAVEYETEARLARAAWMGSITLLGRIRSLCEGPLLLFKGAEVAGLYPGHARAFMDIDLLCPDAAAVHAALRAGGFREVDDPEIYAREQHHLRPLQWPGLWLKVEVHTRPWWPPELTPPPIHEFVDRAVPSVTGVRGICAPSPAHHAIILSSHAWQSQALETLRDLVDIAAVAARADLREVDRIARAWGMQRIWRTTYGAARGLLYEHRPTVAVRMWGRHLPVVRERSVLGNHLQRWLHGFWGFPPSVVLRRIARGLRQDILPHPGETWREKLIRTAYALARPGAPMSSHRQAWQERTALDTDRAGTRSDLVENRRRAGLPDELTEPEDLADTRPGEHGGQL
jgi:hypothetical protein